MLRTIRNHYFYCGFERDEYDEIKKDAYVSNFVVWRVLHFLMAAVFGCMFLISLFDPLIAGNRPFYFAGFVYSVVAICLFEILRKDSLVAQLVIYLSMSVLFLIGGFISQGNPNNNATTFMVLLLVTPMFMIDKPFFMTIELSAASTVFLIWMHGVKPYDVWRLDFYNVITYTVIGCFLNVIANSVRVREFVLTRKIKIQKDTDEMTGLRNKGSLTREINAFLADEANDKGILFMLDVDRFKSINDTFGHGVGDHVIVQIGRFLGERFTRSHEITGRFGGDEFIIFIKGTDDPDTACRVADETAWGVSERVTLPDSAQRVAVSIGIAIYHGHEKNYSEIFKKADTALYKAKADPQNRYCLEGQ